MFRIDACPTWQGENGYISSVRSISPRSTQDRIKVNSFQTVNYILPFDISLSFIETSLNYKLLMKFKKKKTGDVWKNQKYNLLSCSAYISAAVLLLVEFGITLMLDFAAVFGGCFDCLLLDSRKDYLRLLLFSRDRIRISLFLLRAPSITFKLILPPQTATSS